MASEIHTNLPNYYEYLNVPQDASQSTIAQAYENLIASTQAGLNDTLRMQSALFIHNTILPGIHHHLLSGDQAREEYDGQLAAAQRRLAFRNELADDEGLDDVLRQPFFFDPFDYDTETPAFSLRQIAMKLDTEWVQAHTWIRDTSDDHHIFVGFLTHVARRERLAKRMEQIINAVRQTGSDHMDTNVGLERCIDILNPTIERPTVAVYAPNFDGKHLDAGEFVSDLPAQAEMTLSHESLRGCVFGKVESRSDWLKFPGDQSTIQYTLMPEGTDATICLSEVKVPLIFQVNNLERNTDHTAELVVSMENHDPVIEYTIYVRIHVLALPPRVFFEPAATQVQPVWAGIARQGVPTSVVVIPRNTGDEQLVPLAGRISTREQGASAKPERFHANEPITLAIDTSNRPFGAIYDVVFSVEYGLTSGARGPDSLYIRGEVLPPVWQSMKREKPVTERVITASIIGIVGFFLLGGMGAALATSLSSWWWLYLVIPLLFILLTRATVATFLVHKARSGDTSIRMTNVPAWILWWLPIGSGLALALLCMLIANSGSAFFIGGIVGFAITAAFGFIFDRAKSTKLDSSIKGTD